MGARAAGALRGAAAVYSGHEPGGDWLSGGVIAGVKGRVHITEVEDADAADGSSSNPLSRLKQGEAVEAVVLGPVATQQVRSGTPTHVQAVVALEDTYWKRSTAAGPLELSLCSETCHLLYMANTAPLKLC